MITGLFESRYGFPVVGVRVGIGGVSERYLVPFLIDTGSSTTVIHARDAHHRLRLREADLDPRAWPADEIRVSSGIGGGAPYRLVSASYEFAHEDGTAEAFAGTLELGGLGSEGLPSLLGWDVLRHFRLDLNASRGSVALLPP